jgi:hypothetical protein
VRSPANLLITAWVVAVASMFAPGFHAPGNAWYSAATYPTSIACLRVMFVGLEPYNLKADTTLSLLFFAGWLLLAAVMVFACTPVVVLSTRSRASRAIASASWLLLVVWLPPIIEGAGRRSGGRYLWGYYCLAIAFTVAFVACRFPSRPESQPRGFAPIEKY